MTNRVELDRSLAAWLEEEAPPHAPGELHARFIQGMERRRQRPGWATTERWISMETRAQLGAVPRAAIILVILGLLTALVAATVVLGGGAVVPAGASNGRIAFEYQGDLYTVEPDGSDRQLLGDVAGVLEGNPSWSPDGKRLAYWTADASGGTWQLVVVDADGSNAVTVASGVIEVLGGLGEPTWSPDGSSLAFTARTARSSQEQCIGAIGVPGEFCSSRIFVAAADGSTGAVQVGDADMDARTVAWSPDGTTLAFGAGDAGKGIGLYLMDPDGTDVRRIDDEVSGTGWTFLRLDWSPDGKHIAATAGMETWDIWAFAADGSGGTMVSGERNDSEDIGDQLFPAYAPDGALAWWGGARDPGLNYFLAEGGEPVSLGGFSDAPVWSPDGQLIATTTPSAFGDLVLVDRKGQVVVTIEDVDSMPSWQRIPG